MGYPKQDSMPYDEFRAIVAGIRAAYGLSAREYAKLIGMPLGSFRAYIFKKNRATISKAVAGEFITPFKFGFDPSLLPPRKGPSDASEGRWRSGKTPEGYVPFGPVRDAMLEFKAENNSSWQKLADYFDWDRTRLNKLFKGVTADDKNFMTEELASFFMKEIRKARSLSPARRREVFESRRGLGPTVPREVLVQALTEYRYDFGITSWKEVGRQLDIHEDRIRAIRHNRYPTVKRHLYEKVIAAITVARKRQELRLRVKQGDIERRYGIANAPTRDRRAGGQVRTRPVNDSELSVLQ